MSSRRLTAFSKFLLTVGILAGLFFGGQYFLQNTEIGQAFESDATGEKYLGKKIELDGQTLTIINCKHDECELSNGAEISRKLLDNMELHE